MAVYDIWREGYVVTGNRSRAILMAEGIEADSFREACVKAIVSTFLDEKKLTHWGCRLFETEGEARESFG